MIASKSANIHGLMKQMAVVEQNIDNQNNSGLKRIYQANYQHALKIYKIYIFTVELAFWMYITVHYIVFIHRFNDDDFINRNNDNFSENLSISNNYTAIKGRRPLPINTFIPFNTDKHYYYYYLCQMIMVLCCSRFIISSDLLVYGMIMNCIGRLRMLQYSFRNIREFADNDNDLEQVTLYQFSRKCVIEHQQIIE